MLPLFSFVLCSLLLLLPLVVVASPALLSEHEYAATFADWMVNHGRAYTAASLPLKYATFKANHARIAQHNHEAAQGVHSYTMAVNGHADLTVDEYRSLLGYRKGQLNATTRFNPRRHGMTIMQHWRSHSSSSSSTGGGCPAAPSSSTGVAPPSPASGSSSSSTAQPPLPPSASSSTGGVAPSAGGSTGVPAPSNGGVDWRGSGMVGPVKNQGQCGSCWAFASVASMEGAWAYRSGALLSFSEQQLIDCAANGQNTCDQGGDMSDSWAYLLQSSPKPFPETEAAYPYTAESQGTCHYSAAAAQTQVTFSSSVAIESGSESQLQSASGVRPAVAVAIDASQSSFQFYSSGVYSDSSCSTTQLDHAVTVVGYGTQNGTEYVSRLTPDDHVPPAPSYCYLTVCIVCGGLCSVDREELVGHELGHGRLLPAGARRQHVRRRHRGVVHRLNGPCTGAERLDGGGGALWGLCVCECVCACRTW